MCVCVGRAVYRTILSMKHCTGNHTDYADLSNDGTVASYF